MAARPGPSAPKNMRESSEGGSCNQLSRFSLVHSVLLMITVLASVWAEMSQRELEPVCPALAAAEFEILIRKLLVAPSLEIHKVSPFITVALI